MRLFAFATIVALPLRMGMLLCLTTSGDQAMAAPESRIVLENFLDGTLDGRQIFQAEYDSVGEQFGPNLLLKDIEKPDNPRYERGSSSSSANPQLKTGWKAKAKTLVPFFVRSSEVNLPYLLNQWKEAQSPKQGSEEGRLEGLIIRAFHLNKDSERYKDPNWLHNIKVSDHERIPVPYETWMEELIKAHPTKKASTPLADRNQYVRNAHNALYNCATALKSIKQSKGYEALGSSQNRMQNAIDYLMVAARNGRVLRAQYETLLSTEPETNFGLAYTIFRGRGHIERFRRIVQEYKEALIEIQLVIDYFNNKLAPVALAEQLKA